MVGRCGDEMERCDGGKVRGCVAHVALLFVIVPVGVSSHLYVACFFAMFDVLLFYLLGSGTGLMV